MTQVQLAKKSGVSRATIVRIECDPGGSVRLSNLRALAQALGVSTQSLLPRSDL